MNWNGEPSPAASLKSRALATKGLRPTKLWAPRRSTRVDAPPVAPAELRTTTLSATGLLDEARSPQAGSDVATRTTAATARKAIRACRPTRPGERSSQPGWAATARELGLNCGGSMSLGNVCWRRYARTVALVDANAGMLTLRRATSENNNAKPPQEAPTKEHTRADYPAGAQRGQGASGTSYEGIPRRFGPSLHRRSNWAGRVAWTKMPGRSP